MTRLDLVHRDWPTWPVRTGKYLEIRRQGMPELWASMVTISTHQFRVGNTLLVWKVDADWRWCVFNMKSFGMTIGEELRRSAHAADSMTHNLGSRLKTISTEMLGHRRAI